MDIEQYKFKTETSELSPEVLKKAMQYFNSMRVADGFAMLYKATNNLGMLSDLNAFKNAMIESLDNPENNVDDLSKERITEEINLFVERVREERNEGKENEIMENYSFKVPPSEKENK